MVSTKDTNLWSNPKKTISDWLVKTKQKHDRKLFTTPAKVAETGSETKENYCCCCNNAVDNHRVYFGGEKAKSDGILMALEEPTEVDFTPTNVQGICAVRV